MRGGGRDAGGWEWRIDFSWSGWWWSVYRGGERRAHGWGPTMRRAERKARAGLEELRG
jgi:hypothetical protein